MRRRASDGTVVASRRSACLFKFAPIRFVLIFNYRPSQRLISCNLKLRAVLALYLKFDFQKFQMGDFRFMKGGKTGLEAFQRGRKDAQTHETLSLPVKCASAEI